MKVFFSQGNLLYLPFVKKMHPHKTQNLLKQFLAVGMLFFVLVSTCSIQRGIKVVFDVPIEVAQTAKGAKIASSSSQMRTNCTKCSEVQVLTSDASQQMMTMGPSAMMLTVIFSLLFGFPLLDRKNQAILKTPSFTGGLPKYLLFGRLLFYDIK